MERGVDEDRSVGLIDLPLECTLHIFSYASVATTGRCLAVCHAWKAACEDEELWSQLVTTVWGGSVRANTVDGKVAFKNRFRSYAQLHHQRMHDAKGRWLNVTLSDDDDDNDDSVQRQVLEWTGASDQCEGNTVGVAMLETDLKLWPCGRGHDAPYDVVYYEVEVLDAGEHGFIAVGWARREFELSCKQPGWVRQSFGYHGDDGCAYSGYGYGRRFGPTFTTGQVVGTGLVLGGASAANPTPQPRIFYTLDGELIGTPFGGTEAVGSTGRAVAKPLQAAELLLPCIGLHSQGERVRVNFGGSPAAVLKAAPPAPPRPFAFDLGSFMAAFNDEASAQPQQPQQQPPPPPAAVAPFIQLLPWALHDVAFIATRAVETPEAPLASEETAELHRYLASRLGGQAEALHHSWGARSIYHLSSANLAELTLNVLQQDATHFLAQQGGSSSGQGRGGGRAGRGRGGPAASHGGGARGRGRGRGGGGRAASEGD